ncbi:MAG: thiosulfate oxidation carrier protein SoxY [Siculibacillus sp.]|nr:thiosulfate oxidation carrier protein SoxY [Siculibacillus sp.]
MTTIDRRRALALGAGLALLTAAPVGILPAFAANDAAQVAKAFLDGKEPVKGKLAIELPEIAENGATVPLVVSVESPMSEASHVTEVLVLAEENPTSRVVRFAFTPSSGKAEVALRIRLSATQNVWVLAKTNTGEVYLEKKPVKVTIAGCG